VIATKAIPMKVVFMSFPPELLGCVLAAPRPLTRVGEGCGRDITADPADLKA
jgi:hypothetical protein